MGTIQVKGSRNERKGLKEKGEGGGKSVGSMGRAESVEKRTLSYVRGRKS